MGGSVAPDCLTPSKFDRIDDQKLSTGFDIANKMADVLIWTFNRDAHGNSRIDALPLCIALFLSGHARLRLRLWRRRDQVANNWDPQYSANHYS